MISALIPVNLSAVFMVTLKLIGNIWILAKKHAMASAMNMDYVSEGRCML